MLGFQASSFIIFKIEKFCQFPTLSLILHELKNLNFNIKKELTLWLLKPVILEMELVTRNAKTSTLSSSISISFMQCPICKGTLETLIWPKIWKIPSGFFALEMCLFLRVSPLVLVNKHCASYTLREMKINSLNKKNIDI